MHSRPASLIRGDVVHIVAPSGPFDREPFEAGLALLRDAGFVPRFDEGVFARQRFLAGDDTRRTQELLAVLADPSVKAVWTARGGYGATRLLPRLDPKLVGERCPWLVGFSDATALHALWARAGVVSLHGANVTTLASWSATARQELFATLIQGGSQRFIGTPFAPGPAVRGPLLGGNLTVLAAMAGTGFLPSWRGSIVLLEDIGEKPYRLDRALTQLLQANAFAGVLGVVVGQLTGCLGPSADPAEALEVVVEALAPLGVPVLGELPVGHEPSSHAVLLGVDAHLEGRELHVGDLS